jgi:hypothetical protein
MSKQRDSAISHLNAKVRALLREDWRDRAGRLFRRTMSAISRFTKEHNVRPQDLAHEGIELGRKSLHGKAHKDLATAMKDYAEGEHIKIKSEILKRSGLAEVRKNEAQARLLEVQVLQAEADLLEKLHKLGVALHFDEKNGNFTVLRAPGSFDLTTLQSDESETQS